MKSDALEFVWSQKYRPQSIEDCILPDSIKKLFRNIIKQGEFQSLLLTGVQGSGKTTAAKAVCNDIGLDYMMINASENNGIDTLRTVIKQYASTVTLGGDSAHKVIILDEADALTPNTQSALRAFMEEYSKNARFILTANFKNRIIQPLHSRCTTVDFNPRDFRSGELLKDALTRTSELLTAEGVTFDKQTLATIVFKWAPDFRRMINELQRYSTVHGGKIDPGILVSGSIEVDIKGLAKLLREKDFKAMVQWVSDHGDIDPSTIFRKIYDNMRVIVDPPSIPSLVLILAEYGYRSAFVVDQEISTVACLTELMSKCKFLQ